ncbi:MAG: EamA family transporter [Candidatus Methylacidiphilales bacterium]|nr:DMT family transporter [Candidatus Methylacidiphilales bacterium]
MQTLLHIIHVKAYLLFPLLAAMLYALGTMALKASSDLGTDRIRTTFICNFALAAGFLFFYNWKDFPSLPSPCWPIILQAVLFVLGQVFTILALSSGEVSSVTPVFGVKAVFVGFIAAFILGVPVDLLTWIAAVCSVIGIAFLQVHDKPETPREQMYAICYAFFAAVAFAGFDSMTQYWSPRLGFGNLVPPAMVLAAFLSLAIVPRGKVTTWHGVPTAALPYLAIGVGLFTLQSLVLITAIGVYGDAAGANVIYSSRGLWGIMFVWLIGAWFGNSELAASSPRVLVARMVGAFLVTVATVLIFL